MNNTHGRHFVFRYTFVFLILKYQVCYVEDAQGLVFGSPCDDR
jgi:hypothetical protein